MATVDKILLKRGLSANLGTITLNEGEMCYTTDTKKLYVGDSVGNKIEINKSDINALTAQKLATARNIKIASAATGQALFDGSADAEISIVLKDSGVEAGTYTKLTVDSKGLVTNAANLTADDITALGIPKLDESGKLPEGVLPALAITEVYEVASQAAMLALNAQTGDVAVRSDLNKTFILKASPANTLSNWVELRTPTDMVLSVNGRTGAVTLTSTDVGLGNVTNESKTTMFTNPVFTGDAKAKTQDKGDDSDNIATTAFVKLQNYIAEGDTIDGGTF